MMVGHVGHVGRAESCILGGKLGEWKWYLNIEIGSYFKASWSSESQACIYTMK